MSYPWRAGTLSYPVCLCACVPVCSYSYAHIPRVTATTVWGEWICSSYMEGNIIPVKRPAGRGGTPTHYDWLCCTRTKCGGLDLLWSWRWVECVTRGRPYTNPSTHLARTSAHGSTWKQPALSLHILLVTRPNHRHLALVSIFARGLDEE